jgi:hypothetical protein
MKKEIFNSFYVIYKFIIKRWKNISTKKYIKSISSSTSNLSLYISPYDIHGFFGFLLMLRIYDIFLIDSLFPDIMTGLLLCIS